jgi:hypothetical protein
MPKESKDQTKKVLSKLTAKKLKELARKYKLKTSNCRKKIDYVNLILESSELPDILKDEEYFEKKIEEMDAIKAELDEVGEDIEKVVKEVSEIPNMVNEEADELISQRKAIDIDFKDFEDMLEQIRMRFEERNYKEALNYSLSARKLTVTKLRDMELYLWTYAILSSQKIIEDSSKAGTNTDNAVRLLLNAKTSYRNDDIMDNNALIEDLQNKAMELLEGEISDAKTNLQKREKYVEKIKNLGAKVAASEELLQKAWEVLERNDHIRCMQYANQAVEIAKVTREQRIDEIRKGIPLTRSLIEEAKQLGSDVEEAERLLRQAENALEKGDYLMCSELTKRAEKSTVELQNTQIRKAMELRQRQMHNISKSIGKIEPIVREAEIYGMNVANARESLERAKLALNTHDYVNGTLYIEHAEELIKEIEPEMEKYRRKLEIPKPDGGICSRCQSPDLRFFDNGWGKCSNCGNIFRWMTKVTKREKKGLFDKIFKG